MVNEFNAHQSGSMFNLQQYQAKLHEYHAAWRDHMKKKGWDWDSFGTGETSQDNRCWAFLKAPVLLLAVDVVAEHVVGVCHVW